MTNPNEAPCDDCLPEVVVSRGVSYTGDGVLVVTVAHQATCPWLARVAPSGEAPVVSELGVLLHVTADE